MPLLGSPRLVNTAQTKQFFFKQKKFTLPLHRTDELTFCSDALGCVAAVLQRSAYQAV
jgi:hypothetical protein